MIIRDNKTSKFWSRKIERTGYSTSLFCNVSPTSKSIEKLTSVYEKPHGNQTASHLSRIFCLWKTTFKSCKISKARQCDVSRIRWLKTPSSRTGVHCRKRGFLLSQTWLPTCGLIIHYQLHCRSISPCQGLQELLLSTTKGLIGYTFCFSQTLLVNQWPLIFFHSSPILLQSIISLLIQTVHTWCWRKKSLPFSCKE